MSEAVICNKCQSEVRYIDTRKEGIIKCNPSSVKGIQESGRIVEVYLVHDCIDRSSYEILNRENEKRRSWVGPDTL
jgi:hypothetical protein